MLIDFYKIVLSFSNTLWQTHSPVLFDHVHRQKAHTKIIYIYEFVVSFLLPWAHNH